MVRGKHKRSKNARDHAALIDAITQTRAELAYEQSLLASAQEKAAEVERTRIALGEATADRDRTCAREVRRAQDAREAVAAVLRTLVPLSSKGRKAWDRYGDELLEQSGRPADSWELLLSMATGSPATVSVGVQGSRISGEAAAQIQRSRGERRGQQRKATPEQQERIDAVTEYFKSGDDDESPAVGMFRASPLPVLDFSTLADGDAARRLGVRTEPGLPNAEGGSSIDIPDLPSHVLTAVARDSLARQHTAVELLDAWGSALTKQFREVIPQTHITSAEERPTFPSPPDAVALRGWYVAPGWGAWLRAAPGVDDNWRRVTVAATTAVPFWLPPGHTRSYLDSEPLSDSDVADVRLPYPSAFLAFADPVQLASTSVPEDRELRARLAWLGEATQHIAIDPNEDIRAVMSLATYGYNRPQLDIATVMEHWDSQIEGVVLLADALGNLDDLFAWCLAITSPTGNILTRIMIPARLSLTAYRQQVLSLAAVVAWGDWHEPQPVITDPPDVPPSDAEGATPHAIEQSVRILNVKTAREHSAGDSEGGGTVAPHIRRGHWRRQRYGSKRSLVKRVRIAPTLVNAAHGDIAARVYALPVDATASPPD